MKRILSIGLILFLHSACAPGNTHVEYPPLGEPSGDVDPEIVGAAVRNNSGPFQNCFQLARERNPSLSGQVEIRFLINPDGTVGQASAFETSLPPDTTECVVQAFYSVKLPKRASATVAQYPMFFQES